MSEQDNDHRGGGRPRVAALQMASGPGVDANLREAARLVAEAAGQGAQLVVLPENFACMPRHERDKLAVAERDGAGPIQEALAEMARRHAVVLVGGTLPIASDDPERARAACIVYGPDGARLGRYDKIHLFDVEVAPGEAYRESDTLQGGAAPLVIDTPVGRLGVAVCYDLRFPELFRAMAAEGMEIAAVPSAFTAVTGEAHWRVLVRARAVENLCYLIAAAQGGYHVSGRETYGDTLVVDPWGGVLGALAKGPGVVVAELDRRHLETTRERFPVLEHRRL